MEKIGEKSRRFIPLLLLTVHAGLLLYSSRVNFVTVDEPAYFAAGISHWERGSFYLYSVNPPLPRMLGILPVLFAEPERDYRHFIEAPGARPEWEVGLDFVTANRERFFDLLRLARLSGILWSVLGGWFVYRWSADLYGYAAGCLGLSLWCFCPNILGHAALFTSDVPTAVSGFVASYAFWKYLHAPNWRLAFLVGTLLGVALLTKFTLFVLFLVWPLSWLVFRVRQPTKESLVLAGTRLVLILLFGLFILNLGYGFSGTGNRLRSMNFASRSFKGDIDDEEPSGNRFRNLWVGNLILPVPRDVLRGIDLQKKDFEGGFRSYLRGEWRDQGWWYYYLYAMAVKMPLGFLFLFSGSLALVIARSQRCSPLEDEVAVLLPGLAILTLVSSETGFNCHLRYVLPAFPFLFVSTSKVGRFWEVSSLKSGITVAGLLAWGVVSGLLVYPHSLSYFNEAVGGPNHGHEHLLDSNIDWGQDLLFLKEWLDQHPEAAPLQLAYFGRSDPRFVGLEFRLPPRLTPDVFSEKRPNLGPHPGYFAVSVYYLKGVTFPAPDGEGHWRMEPQGSFTYFQHFQPIAKAGYSIFIYHVSEEQANVARKELGLPPLEHGANRS